MGLSKRVLLPQPIESEAMTMLDGAGCEPVLSPDPKPETVGPLMKGAQGLILRTGIKINRDLLSYADDLKIIARTGGGVDNVDVDAATEKGIIVTSNLGVNTASVMEQVIAFMLSLYKQLPRMDRAVREGNFGIRYKNYPRDLLDKVLGLIGFGRIGSALGNACRQIFRMKVLAYDPFLPAEVQKRYQDWVEFADLHTVLTRSDVVSIHVPLTDETRNIIGRRELSWMKPEAIIINTSRGWLINEEALVDALKEGRLAGAGLDVFNEEPVPADSPLLKLDNVIMTPHSAALTRECVIRMATEAVCCVLDVFDGIEPPNVANPEVLNSDGWKHLKRRK